MLKPEMTPSKPLTPAGFSIDSKDALAVDMMQEDWLTNAEHIVLNSEIIQWIKLH